MPYRIRDFVPSDDTRAAIGFIDGSQAYEHALEPDRRLDATVGAQHFAVLMGRMAEKKGRAFVAEEGGRAIGWAVFLPEVAEIYVTEEDRPFGYISELFVVEAARGRGVGRALIGACEEEARRRGLRQMRIGLLAANLRAADIYARSGYAPYALELRRYLGALDDGREGFRARVGALREQTSGRIAGQSGDLIREDRDSP